MANNVLTSLRRICPSPTHSAGGTDAGLARIYLDTNCWLSVRDAYVGRPRSDTHRALYEKLLQLARSGRAVCPVTDTVIYEVFHQNDFSSRLTTARVMDELSAGIALVETAQWMRIEVLHFLRSSRHSSDALYPLSDWVWTRAWWVLGEIHPYLAPVPPEGQTRVQIGICEEMAKRSIGSLLRSLELNQGPATSAFLDNLSRKLTEGKMRHADQIRSRKQAFLIEVAGVLDVHRDDIAVALAQAGESEVVSPADVEAEIEEMRELFRTDKIGTSPPFFNAQGPLPPSHETAGSIILCALADRV